MQTQMSARTLDRILFTGGVVGLGTALLLYLEQIYPLSLVIDGGAGLLLALGFAGRKQLLPEHKLWLLMSCGGVVGAVAVLQGPFTADGLMVLAGVSALAFSNWSGGKALWIPALCIGYLLSLTLLVALRYIQYPVDVLADVNHPGLWLITSGSFLLLVLAMGASIFELKARLWQKIQHLQTSNQHLFRAAYHDELTGCVNKHLLQQQLNPQLQAGGCGTLLVLRLTHLRQLNALHGHQQGDEYIRAMARHMAKSLRSPQQLARLNGPQFAIWLPDLADAQPLAQQLLQVCQAELDLGLSGVNLIAAAVTAPAHGTDLAELLKNADVVFSHQRAGERFTAFSAQMARQMSAHNLAKQRVRHALDTQLFYPVYQSKVSSHDGHICGFEGLARMQCFDQLPPLTPGQFIPLLHEEGWMDEFGRSMLQLIIGDIPVLQQKFGAALKVSANVSPPLFLAQGFTAFIRDCLAHHRVAPQNLVLEITEEVFATEPARIIAVTQELQQMGVEVSLDDFGTGFSSLKYLQLVRFDEIKIDKSFVDRIALDDNSFVLCAAICRLGTDLGCRIVAEGVEQAEQVDQIRRTGCQQMQGFYYARPVSLTALL